MKRLSRLVLGPGEAEPFDRCTSRGNRKPPAGQPSANHAFAFLHSFGGKPTSRLPSISGSDPTKTHSAHCCACTLSAKAGAGHEVRASVNFRAAPRQEDQLSFWNGGAFTPVSNSNRECQLAMLLRPRAFVYSDLREAISIEKRYLTSDLSSRS